MITFFQVVNFGEEDATTIICISEIGKSIVLLHFPVHSI